MTIVNLASNPALEVDASGWGGSRAPVRLAPSAGGLRGAYVARVNGQTGDAALAVNREESVVAGRTYSARMPVRSLIAGRFVGLSFIWFNASGSLVGAVPAGPTVALQPTQWASPQVLAAVAPAGATKLVVQATVQATAAGGAFAPTTGQYIEADCLMIVEGTTVPAYVDGDSPGGFWLGTRHLSRSAVLVPELTAFPEDTCPWVEVVLEVLPPTAARIRLTRTAERRTLAVSGAIDAPVSGAFKAPDFEVPMDVEVVYRAELLDAGGGSLGFTLPASIEMPFPERANGDWLCVHNALEPSSAVWVRLAKTGGETRTIAIDGSVTYPQGRTLGLVSATGRRGMVGVAVHVETQTYEDGERFDALFGEGFGESLQRRYPVLCIRVPRSLRRIRWPAMWMAGILSVAGETNFAHDRMVWRATADEVARPLPALVLPLLRRKDIAAFYASRQAVANDNASRFAVSRRYDIGGAGGD